MTIEEMKREIAKDEETQSLTLHGMDILKVYQYLLAKHDKNRDQHYTPKLITTPYIEFVLEPTEKKKLAIKQDKIKKYMDIFEAEVHIQEASLDEFDLFSESREIAMKEAKTFLDGFSKKTHPKGLFIYGMYGSGKSFLLSALTKALTLQGKMVILTYVPDLVRSMKQGMQEHDLEKRINILKQVDVLMLDDLGGEFSSAWFRDEILMPLLQYRLSANLATCFSSNYSLRELTETLSVSNASEDNRIKAARLVRRIHDMTHVIKLSDTYKNEDSVL